MFIHTLRRSHIFYLFQKLFPPIDYFVLQLLLNTGSNARSQVRFRSESAGLPLVLALLCRIFIQYGYFGVVLGVHLLNTKVCGTHHDLRDSTMDVRKLERMPCRCLYWVGGEDIFLLSPHIQYIITGTFHVKCFSYVVWCTVQYCM